MSFSGILFTYFGRDVFVAGFTLFLLFLHFRFDAACWRMQGPLSRPLRRFRHPFHAFSPHACATCAHVIFIEISPAALPKILWWHKKKERIYFRDIRDLILLLAIFAFIFAEFVLFHFAALSPTIGKVDELIFPACSTPLTAYIDRVRVCLSL